MHDPLPVSGRQPMRQLTSDLDDVSEREQGPTHERPERRTGNVLADQVQLVADFLERIDGRDVGMRQRRGRSGFTTESLATTRIAADLRKRAP